MVNYLNAKIYRIVCNESGRQYIGSTTIKLSTRLSQHKKLFKSGKSGTSKEVLKNGDYNIILLEDYPCDRKEQLLQRERYYIETMECVNKKIPLQTQHEWYMNNREEYIARQTAWNNENKERLKEYQKTFQDKKKGVFVDLQTGVEDIVVDENIHLDIEELYQSNELMSDDDIYSYIEAQFNNKNI